MDRRHTRMTDLRLAGRAVVDAVSASEDSAESRLFRVLQRVFDAYAGAEVPPPSARETMRRDMHDAVDAYHTNKLHERGPQRPRHTPAPRKKV